MERIEPWSLRRQDLLMGIQTATLVNWLRLGRGRGLKVKDVVPDWDKAPKRDPGQMVKLLRQWGHWFKQSVTGDKPSPK
jgi:type II secretory pathway component PulL